MPKRTDSNQSTIVAQLREFGATVWDVHECGHGAPDIVCGMHGRSYLFEIKSPGGRLNQEEIAWRDKWRGNYYVIFNVEQAIEILTQED